MICIAFCCVGTVGVGDNQIGVHRYTLLLECYLSNGRETHGQCQDDCIRTIVSLSRIVFHSYSSSCRSSHNPSLKYMLGKSICSEKADRT